MSISVVKVRWFVALFFTLDIFSFFTLGGTTLLGGGHLSVGRGAEVNLVTSLHPYPLLTPLTLYRRKPTMGRKAALLREPREPPQPPGDKEPQQPENPTENPPVTLETQPAVLGVPRRDWPPRPRRRPRKQEPCSKRLKAPQNPILQVRSAAKQEIQ